MMVPPITKAPEGMTMMVEVMKVMMVEMTKVMMVEMIVKEVVTNLMIEETTAKITAIAAPKILSAGKAAKSAKKNYSEVITNLMKAMMVEVIVKEVVTNLMIEATTAKITAIVAPKILSAGRAAKNARKNYSEVITNLMKAMMIEVIVVEVVAVEVMTNLMKEAKNAKITAIAVVEIGGARLCVIFACRPLNVAVAVIVVNVAVVVDVAVVVIVVDVAVVVIVVDVAVVVDVADVADVTECKKCDGEVISSCWLECQTNEAKCL